MAGQGQADVSISFSGTYFSIREANIWQKRENISLTLYITGKLEIPVNARHIAINLRIIPLVPKAKSDGVFSNWSLFQKVTVTNWTVATVRKWRKHAYITYSVLLRCKNNIKCLTEKTYVASPNESVPMMQNIDRI